MVQAPCGIPSILLGWTAWMLKYLQYKTSLIFDLGVYNIMHLIVARGKGYNMYEMKGTVVKPDILEIYKYDIVFN